MASLPQISAKGLPTSAARSPVVISITTFANTSGKFNRKFLARLPDDPSLSRSHTAAVLVDRD